MIPTWFDIVVMIILIGCLCWIFAAARMTQAEIRNRKQRRDRICKHCNGKLPSIKYAGDLAHWLGKRCICNDIRKMSLSDISKEGSTPWRGNS